MLICEFSTNFSTILKGFYSRDLKKQKEMNLALLGKRELKYFCSGTTEVMVAWIRSSTLYSMKKL